MEAVERSFVAALMERCDGNVSRASREAGIHRSYLQKLLARYRGGVGGALDKPAPARTEARGEE